jgi:hypothetical protein
MLIVFGQAVAGIAGAPDYQVGDKATTDVLTPVQLVVVDHERTESLRNQEAGRVSVFFRFNTNTAADAEVRMLNAYGLAKEGFLKSIERNYKKRKLDADTVADERFGKAVASYQKQNRAFPLTTNLAGLWVLGESDQSILEDLTSTLRDTMRGYVRPDNLSALARSGPQTVRVVMVGSTNALDLDTALAQSAGINKSNLVGIGRAKRDLQAKFGPEEQWAGKFLAGFVRENCLPDDLLTQESRARRTDPILAADTYEPGTAIVKAGQLIDVKIKAALDELANRAEAETVKATAAEDKRKAEAVTAQLAEVAAQARAQTRATEKRYLGLLVTVILAAFVAMAGLWVAARRRPKPSLLPALVSQDATHIAESLPVPNVTTRERLLPELTRWIRRSFLQKLLHSNAALTETQRQAALQVAELELRLAHIKGPLEERLKAYEQRIAELERELEARGAENRELLKATIKMARERLEAQRSGEGVAWN